MLRRTPPPRSACLRPLLEADSLGFVDNLYCRDSGVICDRLEGQIEFTLCGWLHLRPPEGQNVCVFLPMRRPPMGIPWPSLPIRTATSSTCSTAKPPCPSPQSAAILPQTKPGVWRFSNTVTFTNPSASYTCSYVSSLL